jgi:ATP-binding cassette subfamily B protein
MRQLSEIFRLLVRYRSHLLAGAFFVLVTNTILIFGPRVLGMAVDDLRDGLVRHSLGWYLGWLLAISLGQGLARFAMRRILIGTSRRVERDLRATYLARLLELPRSFYARRYTGDIMSRATQDIENVRMAAGPALMYSLDTILLSAYALTMMLLIHPALTGIVLALLPIISGLVWWLSHHIHLATMDAQRCFGRVSTVVQEALSGIRVIQAYVREEEQARRFDDQLVEYRRLQMRLVGLQSAFRPLLGLLFAAGQGLVLWQGGRLIVEGALTLGDYVAFSTYLTLLSWPMVATGWSLSLLQRGSAGMRRLNEVLGAPVELAWGGARPRLQARLSVQGLGFRYPDAEEDALQDLSFDLEPGQAMGIVGLTGCGKSTLLRLLARQADPDRGRILLDGHDIRSLDPGLLRSVMTVVPQDAFLFSATLAGNVAYGRPDAPRAELERAAADSRLEQDLPQLPAGWETLVGERGVTLSGGQKQRATIARALVPEAPILLLDDALSAIDTRTEEALVHRLRDVMARRTVLIASHRLSIMREVDVIIVLDQGRLVERGTHDELVKRGGLYAELWRRQELRSALEEAA